MVYTYTFASIKMNICTSKGYVLYSVYDNFLKCIDYAHLFFYIDIILLVDWTFYGVKHS